MAFQDRVEAVGQRGGSVLDPWRHFGIDPAVDETVVDELAECGGQHTFGYVRYGAEQFVIAHCAVFVQVHQYGQRPFVAHPLCQQGRLAIFIVKFFHLRGLSKSLLHSMLTCV